MNNMPYIKENARIAKIVRMNLSDDLTGEEVQRILSSKCNPDAFATDRDLQQILAKHQLLHGSRGSNYEV